MLTKNCKTILRYITSLPDRSRLSEHQLTEVAENTGISFEAALSACKELDKDGLANIKITHLRNGQDLPTGVTLTESGLNYKALIRARYAKYIADKWIDIIASVISIISLIVSIRTALSN